jgi:hypothetical protein
VSRIRGPRLAKTAASRRRSRIADHVRYSVSLLLGNYPRLYYPVMRWREHYRDLLISDRTELVIEGYPRSGNTFAVAALEYAQTRKLAIARHTHSPAQVIEAVRRRLPVLVLVREPRDAIVSLVIREPIVSLEMALKRYVHYHNRILPYAGGYVVGTFSEVTTNYAPVIERLNQAFHLSLARFEHKSANCEIVFTIVENMEREVARGRVAETRVARPSAVRSEPKARLLEVLAHEEHRELLEQCDKLYYQFRDLAVAAERAVGTEGMRD